MSQWPSIKELVANVQSGKTTAVSLVEASLATIAKNKEYNAIISVVDSALERAKEIDESISHGDDVGRLVGVPFIVKDNFLVAGTMTTAASNILKNFEAPYTATSVKRLEEAGAIVVAKANLDSFAHGSSTENSDWGPTLNPHDKTRVPGGSSGGSAAAVVLDMAPFALGTDTGGSIRLPASFTGCVGFKPTYGTVSRYGVVAMASSTDVIGPLTRSVDDASVVLDVLANRDPLDGTTIERNPAGYVVDDTKNLEGKTIGIIKEHFGAGVDGETAKAVQTAIDTAKQCGATVKDISIPEIDMALPVYYIVMPAEVSSNLSRYDGIRYGLSEAGESLDDIYYNSRTHGFNDEVKRRIMIGTYVLSSGYYDAYYKRAQAVRTLLIEEFQKAFTEVDFLAGPTSPTTAFKLGDNTDDPLQMYLADIMTVATNLVGIPGVSIPVGKDSNKMPIGLQLMAPARHDAELLQAAYCLEGIVGYES